YLTVYSASKAFILSFTRSLRYELRKSNINVSCLVPGPTDTQWVKRAGIGSHTLKTADIFNMTPDEVGKIGVRGMFNNKSEIITGLTNKLNAFFPKFFPKRFVEGIGGRIYDPEKNASKS
ncbi:MAG TPA: SDR family NAD(P)-dependent oxidoreductase, partial [Chitinophagaceae bacterium]|nr:SDR family NAD(P)-dependent oxidoreductase [Chitinophagaceae bacterium]